LPSNVIPIESKFYIKEGIPESKVTAITVYMIDPNKPNSASNQTAAATLKVDLIHHLGEP